MPSEKSAKKAVKEPLELLTQRTGDLYEAMDHYCLTRLEQARKTLHKVEKRRTQTQLALLEAQQRLEKAVADEKPKAQDKARGKIEALGHELDALTQRQEVNQRGFQALQAEVQTTMTLARKLHEQARSTSAAPVETPTPPKPTRSTPSRSPRKTATTRKAPANQPPAST